MDDLSAKINQILSDPQALQQIKGLGEQLGLPATFNNEPKKSSVEPTENSAFSPDMMGMIGKLYPLMSNINKEDDTSRLLCALRPFLSVERRKKLDEASKLIKMMKLLPLIKDTGVLDSLF